MHRRLGEVQSLLNQWSKAGYGATWLATARQERGVMRVKNGQCIPTLHIIVLGEGVAFIAPQEALRQGHRTVVDDLAFQSGRPLEDGELVLRPEIRLDLVRDPVFLNLAAKGLPPTNVSGIKEPSQVLTVPAHYLLKPKAWPKKSYVLYQHIFGTGHSYPNDGFFYVGVTTRSWQARWAEHLRAVETGSPLLFHKKLREEFKVGRVHYINHKVMDITDDVEMLYGAEERLVEGHWHDARRLNMIPGGKSGLKYLRENGILAERVVPMPDERDRILADRIHEHPRKGLPAPWVSQKWKDDEWAIAQICGREGRLSVEQVSAIRDLAKTHSVAVIADRIGARNSDQVQRVIDGKTYSRVV
jgi:hypothetical protein